MRKMAENLHEDLRPLQLNDEIFSAFENLFEQQDHDLEKLIEHVENLERGQKSKITLDLSTDQDQSLLRTSRAIRYEAEWYVQHVCERLRTIDVKTLWGPMLRKLGEHHLCIATTNYDRSIEIACKSWDVPFYDGFENLSSDSELAKWRGLENSTAQNLFLIKIHGSTDWYRGNDGQVYKIRHPMALYGNLTLSLNDENGQVENQMKSSLILPTREKLTTLPPFQDLITDFRNFARETDLAIFIGTSLRDPDLKEVCEQCAERGVPTFLVTVDENLRIPKKVRKILQTASEFLTLTLPQFFANNDVEFLDRCSNGEQRTTDMRSVLKTLVMAFDESNDAETVCRAIDNLVDNQVMLDKYDIRKLLSHSDVMVQRYALALIPQSCDNEELLAFAKELAESHDDVTFQDEFNMMTQLIATLPASPA